jgi:hypothetical protein
MDRGGAAVTVAYATSSSPRLPRARSVPRPRSGG